MPVKVWFVYESPDSRPRSKYMLPTQRDIKYTLALEACRKKIGLSEHQWISAIKQKHRPAERRRRPEALAAPRHVICEVDEIEARASGWRAGYYRVDLSPGEVAKQLATLLAIEPQARR